MLRFESENVENCALRELLANLDPCRSPRLCWNWPKYRTQKGYGCIIFNGVKFPVHRLSFKHFKGLIPKGMVVMHECDNPSCFNPDHLYLGTHQENMQDMVRKGRSRKKQPLSDESAARVEELAGKRDLHSAVGLPTRRRRA